MAAVALLATACGASPPAPVAVPDEVVFVRDGVVIDGRFEALQWTPGETVRGAIAPQSPECIPLFSVDLGDVSRLVAMGGASPDTSLAFSPDGSRLAVGSYRGEVVVLDGWTGAVQARTSLAETMVKKVAWAPDGGTVYAAEQSPDAYVHAMDPATLKPRWSLRLADHVGSSPAPDGEDIYGVYTLPAAYELVVLPDGALLVGANHGWNESDGTRRNQARLLRVTPEGEVAAAWPAAGATEVTFNTLRADPEGGLAIVAVGRSAAGAPPPGLPVGGVQVVSTADLTPIASFVPPPLPPHFTQTFIWEAIDVDAAAGVGIVGLSDGRLFGFPLTPGGEPWRIEVSTPVLAGDIPISASIGHGWMHDGAVLVLTSGTNIPYGSASPEARPSSPHPKANAVFAYGLEDQQLRWTWTGAPHLNGLVEVGDVALVGTRARSADAREDQYGALAFDLADGRKVAFCATEGPTFFRPTGTADGRIAVAEHPFGRGDGGLGGAYRVTVLR